MRLTILAIDGMDRSVSESLGDRLPNVRRMNWAGQSRFTSVFPPDTDTAWPSFYTGLSPAEHGVFKYRDPGNPNHRPRSGTDDATYRGKSMWDVATQLGKRSCVCLPHNIYPGWDINGMMVTRSGSGVTPDTPIRATGGTVSVDSRETRALNGLQRMFTDRELSSALEHLRERESAEESLAWQLYERERWDLFYAYFSVVDGLQHYFWRFHEPTHPNFEPGSPFQSVVADVYKRADDLIGRFAAAAAPDECLLVLSDHGHGRRPTQLFHLNEFLRQAGYLQAERGGRRRSRVLIKRGISNAVAAYVSRFGLPPFAKAATRLMPSLKKSVSSSGGVDYQQSRAYVAEMSSMKGYSYGGIRLNVAPQERAALARRVMDDLATLRAPDTGAPLVTWMELRENVDSGAFLSEIPDILLELQSDYGVSSGVHVPLVEPGFMHRVQSGSHRRSTPTLLLQGDADVEAFGEDDGDLSLMDLNRFVCQQMRA
jgi:predicted AlkP superfamily phosphohydrolase/phosphomutase